MELIFCRGGTKEHTPIVLGAGWRYGLRSDYVAYHDDVFFLDINYQKGREAWHAHEQRALELHPTLTMIPDWEKQYSYDELYAMHKRLNSAGLQTMWIPKQEHIVSRIPADSIVGISVPTRHGAFLPAPKEVIGRKLHLLGGDPDALRYLIDVVYPQSEVYSIDTSYFVGMAFNGRYWSANDGKWIQTKNQYSNKKLIERSANNIRDYLHAQTVQAFNMRRKPIRRIWNWIHGVKTNQLELLAS